MTGGKRSTARSITRWAGALAVVCGLAMPSLAQPASPGSVKPSERAPGPDKAPASKPAVPAKPAAPGKAPPASGRPVVPTVGAWFHDQVEGVLNALSDSEGKGADYDRAKAGLDALLEKLAVWGSATDGDAFREVAVARRMVNQLAQLDDRSRPEMLKFLRERPALRAAMAFAVKPEAQKVGAVYAVLTQLRGQHESQLEKFANLTAALCVVHDRAWLMQINENRAKSPGPAALFEYYSKNDRQMAYGVTGMPVELLIYVVSAAAPIEDLEWARGKYGGDRQIENRYHEIRYDYDYFKNGGVKKSTAAGWSLRGILANGGVCADQAYFAMTVAQSMGIPAAYVSARDGEVGHAWVGYLEAKGRDASWNFDAGRFGTYMQIRGVLTDPQTRKRVSDASVAVMARAMTQPADDRQEAEALFDAAEYLRSHEVQAPARGAGPGGDGAAGPHFKRTKPRDTGADGQQELIEAGLRRTPAAVRGWRLVGSLAESGRLSLADKQRWAEVLYNLCGKEYPYFSFEILKPMIQTVGDVRAREALWDRTAALFAAKPDLVSEIRLAQGEMWDDQGDSKRAWECYQDVVKKYVNAGPFVVEAVDRCERLLTDAKKPAATVLDLYASAWKQAQKPTSLAPEFRSQSNWFRLGMKYAEKLESTGRGGDASKIREQLKR